MFYTFKKLIIVNSKFIINSYRFTTFKIVNERVLKNVQSEKKKKNVPYILIPKLRQKKANIKNAIGNYLFLNLSINKAVKCEYHLCVKGSVE